MKKVHFESRHVNAKPEDFDWKFNTSNNIVAGSIIPEMPLKKRFTAYCSDEVDGRNGNDDFECKPCDITDNRRGNESRSDARRMRVKIRFPRLSNRTGESANEI